MKYIIVIFYSLIFPIISLKEPVQKICINCKYFIPDNNNGVYGKCSLFPKKEAKIKFLVNGIDEEEYYYCSTVRATNDICGEEGKYYKKKRSS
jgi:hypothetical protein